jgi:hypothetical protein
VGKCGAIDQMIDRILGTNCQASGGGSQQGNGSGAGPLPTPSLPLPSLSVPPLPSPTLSIPPLPTPSGLAAGESGSAAAFALPEGMAELLSFVMAGAG